MTVHEWLRTNTYHHSDFADLGTMVQAKRKQGLTLSLCLPTLNEERTIGKEVILFKSELMTRYPLLDEIAVIDSGSTDGTREIASSYGADVYLADEILPELPNKSGKGENLWKALYQLTGDIIVYVDADIKNIHPRFVYGLVAPLIFRPEIKYVKAFYERPLAFSEGTRDAGGGRVTEILVRPLFSLFVPELTAIMQPLSGEYAVRRSVVENIPFPVGYGVETSHLLDVYQRWGLEAFAQTDLDQRVHRNQDTVALGKMAFGILRVFLRRMEARGAMTKGRKLNDIMRQFTAKSDVYELAEHVIPEEERPPMVEIPAYRKKRGLDV